MHSAWQYLCSVRFYVVVVVFCFIFFRLICCRRFFKFYFSVFFFLSPLLGAESVCVCVRMCVHLIPLNFSRRCLCCFFVASFFVSLQTKTIHCTLPAFDRALCMSFVFTLFFLHFSLFILNLFHQLFIFIFFSLPFRLLVWFFSFSSFFFVVRMFCIRSIISYVCFVCCL